MARKRSRKQKAKQRATARTQRQQKRQTKRTERQITRQTKRTERQAQRQETKRARVAGKTARKTAQFEAGFAPGSGAAQVIGAVGEAVPGIAQAGLGLAGALAGEEGGFADVLGEFGAMDMFGSAPAEAPEMEQFDEFGAAVSAPLPVPITQQPWFIPAVGVASVVGIGAIYMMTKKGNGRNGRNGG